MMTRRSYGIEMELVVRIFSNYTCLYERWSFLWQKLVHEVTCWEGCHSFFRRKQDWQTLNSNRWKIRDYMSNILKIHSWLLMLWLIVINFKPDWTTFKLECTMDNKSNQMKTLPAIFTTMTKVMGDIDP